MFTVFSTKNQKHLPYHTLCTDSIAPPHDQQHNHRTKALALGTHMQAVEQEINAATLLHPLPTALQLHVHFSIISYSQPPAYNSY
jgi:hypothetical protein